MGNAAVKGIVLAGGFGSRLHPMTKIISKHLLPVYDKPMIYYPLATLMQADIKDFLIICTENDLGAYEKLLGDGHGFGISISYSVQERPNGIAEALLIAEDFIGDSRFCLILADNVIDGGEVSKKIKESCLGSGAEIFAFRVHDPQRFGVVEFDQDKVLSIEEKPLEPKSNYAVIGLYVYDKQAIDYAKKLQPSSRGELEITDVNKQYLETGELTVSLLGDDVFWVDAGTTDSLLVASNYIKGQSQKGIIVGSPEKVSIDKAWRVKVRD